MLLWKWSQATNEVNSLAISQFFGQEIQNGEGVLVGHNVETTPVLLSKDRPE